MTLVQLKIFLIKLQIISLFPNWKNTIFSPQIVFFYTAIPKYSKDIWSKMVNKVLNWMEILRSKKWKLMFLSVFCFLYLGDKVPNQLPHWPRLKQRAPGTMSHARAAGNIINFFQDTELSGHQSTKFTKSPQAKNSLIPGQIKQK